MPVMQQVSTPSTRGPLIASSASSRCAEVPETSLTSSPRSHHLPTRLQEPSPAMIRSNSQRDHVRVPISEAWEQDPFASVNSSRRPSSASANSDSPVLHQQFFRRPSTQSNNKEPFPRPIIRWSQHYQPDSPSPIDGSPRRDHSHVDFHPESRESIDDQEQHEETSSTIRFALNPFRSSTTIPEPFADRAPRYPSEKSSRPHRSRRTRHRRVSEQSTPSKSFGDRPLGKYIAWFLIIALIAVVASVTVTLSLRSSRRANDGDNVIGSFDSGVTYIPPSFSASAPASAPSSSSNQPSNPLSVSAILLSSSSSDVEAATALLTAPSSEAPNSSLTTKTTTTSAPSTRSARALSTAASTRGRLALRRDRRGVHP
ncbi:BQ2448_7191 [Microbotryum intermedium]|uniref:BQ2448_7191 protein n=1 Tax=Microbotryum intermedium TaxID=269621 RepID=A0A238FQ94_9BASI|nr:BQ2448_7191 [Microbotryum intermedium]